MDPTTIFYNLFEINLYKNYYQKNLNIKLVKLGVVLILSL